jgi:uncharacterized membrane protein YidH (DUF202 family)
VTGPPRDGGPAAGGPARDGAARDGAARGGLARERTSLAWVRTALAIVVAGALLLRSGARLGGWWQAPGLVALLAGALLLADTYRRQRQARGADAPPDPAAAAALLRAIGLGATLLCLTSLVLLVAGW